MEGLDVSKHGEKCISVSYLVKELDASVHGGSVHGGRYANGLKKDEDMAVTAV